MHNDLVHGKLLGLMEDLVFKTLEWHEQFKACNTRAETDRVPRHVQWIKQGRKVCWIRKEGRSRGLGGCLRDSTGGFICGFTCNGPPGLSVLGTELAAIREGLQTMFAYEYTSFILAFNSQKTVSMLKGMVDGGVMLGI